MQGKTEQLFLTFERKKEVFCAKAINIGVVEDYQK